MSTGKFVTFVPQFVVQNLHHTVSWTIYIFKSLSSLLVGVTIILASLIDSDEGVPKRANKALFFCGEKDSEAKRLSKDFV